MKRHLTAARDTLSQLTQLPAAAQLTGDARTQVSQLISNFNELLTTNADWRSAYTKLQGNLTALVGEPRADESPTPAAAGTAGAVGTSGTVAIDPAIRAKLVEFRSHLTEFEKAAGGSGTPAASAQRRRRPRTAAPCEPSAAAAPAPLRRRCLEHGDTAAAPRPPRARDRITGAGRDDRQHVADSCDGGHLGHRHADAGSRGTGHEAVDVRPRRGQLAGR